MLDDTMKKLSDHQLLGMVEVMLDDDHRVDDATATYVAAYEEAMTRPSVKAIIDINYPDIE